MKGFETTELGRFEFDGTEYILDVDAYGVYSLSEIRADGVPYLLYEGDLYEVEAEMFSILGVGVDANRKARTA